MLWRPNWLQIFWIFLVSAELGLANKEGYYGKYIGKLSQLHHGVSGDVFAVDARTLHLRNFNYDGEGPAAYFYAGSTKAPGVGGFRVRDERGTTNVLPKYRNKHITITLPEGQNLQNIRWFSVWCDEFSVNFGDVKIPKNLDFPKPQKINGLSGVHGVSSEPIVIVDAQTLLIPSFSYDGEAPDAKFWVGRGFKPSPQGIRIPDENGKEIPLRRYDRKTIVLTLPGDLTIFDIGHFGVWCEAFTVDFGHVQIPRGLNVPPSLKMLGVSPQSKLNCEVLWDDFAYEVRWAVAGDSIVLQLVARLENNEYMSFGLSGDNGRSRMVGGDVVVAWVDKDSLKGYAQDYFLDAKSQCSGGRGSCPDDNIIAGSDSVRLLNAALVNGYSIVTFQRSLKAQDELDKPVYTNQSQPIIWAIGPLNSKKEVSYHSLANRGDIFIDFGRPPKWNCPTPESVSDQAEPEDSQEKIREQENLDTRRVPDARIADTRVQETGRRESRPKTTIPTPAPAPKTNAWEIPAIKCYEPEDGVFYAQMGPTGGKRGYSAITGHVGWGISWYINGLLIPEINVVRGRTYTFIVEGGLDPETPARYHPFYITDDPVGGYQYKTPEERANIQIFAGAVQNKRGEVRPTGVGRLCNWTPDPNQPPADEFSSFGAYQRTLRLECDPGNPGIIQWTVDKDTPDTVYYQCYTHRYLGWKINVHDHCEGEAASDPVPSIVKAPSDVLKSYEEDAEGSESVNFETRVKPDIELLKTLTSKNQSLGINEFAVHANVVKYQPEYYTKTGEELSSSSNSKGGLLVPKTPVVIPQVINDVNAHIPPTLLYPLQPQFPVQVLLPEVNNVQIPTDTKLHNYPSRVHSYSVTEETLEDDKKPTFQNFQIIPLGLSKPAEEFFGQVKTEILQQKAPLLQTFPNIQQIQNTNDFLQIPSNIKIQSEEIQKPLIHKKPLNRPPNRLKKPLHPLASPQRPALPLRTSLAGKPTRLPVATIPKIVQIPMTKTSLNSHRINLQHRPVDLNKQESQKLQQIRFQFHGYKKQQEPGFVKKPQQTELLSSSSAHRQSLRNEQYAQNTGFNPDSVQVEGGFKPILNTGIAPIRNVNLIDRADTDFATNDDGKVGTVDLVDKDTQKLRGFKKREDGNEEKEDGKQVDLFKNLEPQAFEPIFIPSFPDDSSKEHQDKFYEKTIPDLKTKNDKFQYENSQKNTHGYSRMRPTASVVSRPLNPNHRPLLQGGVPRWRSQESEPSLEEEGRNVFLNKVNNFSLANTKRADNIQEVLRKFDESEVEASSSAKRAVTDTTASEADEKIAMADEKKNFYLPPQGPRFLAYDGKLVKAELPPVLPDELPGPDVSKLPQFVPYRGVIPPLSQTINAKNLPQLRSSKLARDDILPPSGKAGLKSSESRALDSSESFSKESLHSQGERSEPGRKKRSPDHIPGHVGPDHHDHHDHDHHDHHDHSHHNSSSTSSSKLFLLAFSTFVYFFKYFSL